MKLAELNLLSEISLTNLTSSNLARQLAQVLEQQGLIIGNDPDAKRDAHRANVDYLLTFQMNSWGGRGQKWQIYCNRSKVNPSLMVRGEDGKVFTYPIGSGTTKLLRSILGDIRSRMQFQRNSREWSNYRSSDTTSGNNDETVEYVQP